MSGRLIIINKQRGEYHSLAKIEILSANSSREIGRLMRKKAFYFDYFTKKNGHFSNGSRALELNGQDIFSQLSELNRLLKNASGLICIKGKTGPLDLVRSGYYAQSLSEKLYRENIGSCVLGFVPYSGVNYCVAIGRTKQSAKKQAESLVESAFIESYLESNLQQFLPEYMWPRHYVQLNGLPLAATGKIDYKALPKVNVARNQYLAPQSVLEERVCEIWQEVLDVEQVGVKDDFFRLGGDSILAIKILHKMEMLLDQHIQVSEIYSYKNIRDILSSSKKSVLIHVVKSVCEKPMLSFAQDRMWFIESYEEGSSAYNIPIYLELDDKVDLNLFRLSIESIVERHEILRTIFVQDELSGDYYQSVLNDSLEIHKKTIQSEADVKKVVDADVDMIFDIEASIPIYVCIYEVTGDSPRRYVLINIHHVAFDGWSTEILMGELESFYEYYSRGSSLMLPSLPVQYKDFAVWQKIYLTDESLSEHISYWKSKLDNFENLHFPTDYDRPKVISYLGDDYNFKINKTLSKRIRQMSQQEGVTLYSVLLAAFDILLLKYTRQTDIVIGAPIANRNYKEIVDLIGVFSNHLVIRADLKNRTIHQLIHQIHNTLTEAHDYQDFPFEKLINLLDVSRDMSRHPIFQIVFSVQSFGSGGISENGLWRACDDFDVAPPAKADLSLYIDDSFDELHCRLNYSTSLFHKETITNIAQHFSLILEEISRKDIEKTYIQDVSMVGKGEFEDILKLGRGGESSIPAVRLVDLFRKRVLAGNDYDDVLFFEGHSLSLSELDRQSSMLSNYIAELSSELRAIRQGDFFIPICLDRGLDIVVAVIAALKLGVAFVPIDPKISQSRIDYILKDLGNVFIVTQNCYQGKFKDKHVALIDDTKIRQKIERQPDYINMSNGLNSTLAYVIYTSGTTGKPKGVMVENKSIVNLAYSLRKSLINMSDKERIAQFCSMSFDTFCSDVALFMAFDYKLYILDDRARKDVFELVADIRDLNITYIDVPTSIFKLLYESRSSMKKYFGSLKYMIVGGEPFPKLDQWNFSDVSIVNAYGPTEATVEVTLTAYDKNNFLDSHQESIGKPIHNSQVYVLDEFLRPVPMGVIGELYLCGANLARGYVNDEGLTQEKFIENPFYTQNDGFSSKRLYKTGDLVKWLPSGSLQYIGRRDYQVKIRGYRVELGEIESELKSLEYIRQACVVVKKIGYAKKVIAYYTAVGKVDRDKSKEIVSLWHDVYEQELYCAGNKANYDSDFSGWTSSYDGKDIPLDEMMLWRGATINRILALSPKNVVEVGVGSGLMLYRLIGHVDSYLATDFSELAIDRINEINQLEEFGSKVTAVGLEAIEVNAATFNDSTFDCVIINSVCQYFPSLDYLETVLLNAVSLIDNGKIFIGDVRDFRLLSVFSYDVQSSGDNTTDTDKVYFSALKEEELTVSPIYFIEFARKYNLLADILIKYEDTINELTLYRYDVTLFKQSCSNEIDRISNIDRMSYSPHIDIASILAEHAGLPLVIDAYPHKALAEKVAQYKKFMGECEFVIHPNVVGISELLEIAKENKFFLKVSNVTKGAALHEVSLTFIPIGCEKPIYTIDLYEAYYENQYANIPYALQLSPLEVEKELSKSLPDFMMPDTFVHIYQLPLNVSGKLDRSKLPDPDFSLIASEHVFAKTAQEILISDVWEKILGLRGVGITDGFFKLGGNSILAIKAAYKMSQVLGQHVAVVDIFKYRTIEKILLALDENDVQPVIIPKAKEMDIYPLSYAQKRLWFIEQYEGGTNAYHIPLLLEINQKIDIESLKKTLVAIVRRHEILRTVFRKDENGMDCQKILDQPLEVVEKQCQRGVFESDIIKVINTPFNLREEYPIRVCIYKVKSEYYLLINMHHIASDGWSVEVFFKEFLEYYLHYSQGVTVNLPLLGIQYKDFSLWQKNYLQGSVLADQIAYWKEQLMGYKPLNLMSDKVRPSKIDYRGAQVNFELGEELSRKLRALLQKKDYTLYTVLLAGFYVLLNKYSHQTDIVIGAPVANRHYSQVLDLIGFFTNTLALREEIDIDQPAGRLIEQVHQHLLEAQRYQDLPFERLVEELGVVRDPSRHSIFQVMFGVQDFGGSYQSESILKVFTVMDLASQYQVSKFDLTCILNNLKESMSGVITYATSLYRKETIEQLIQHYIEILKYMVEDSSQPISHYCLLTKAEYKKIIYEWNQTGRALPKDKTLYQLFQAQVRRTPDSVAMIYEDKQLTYRELNEKSNQLARYIRKRTKAITKNSLKPSMLVAIYLDRSLEMMIGILGTLKAGGAYVPLDLDYPAARVNYILDDAVISLVLVQSHREEQFKKIVKKKEVQLIVLDSVTLNDEIKTNLPVYSGADDLAYVIYTSGTTGKPKGVCIPNAGIVNFIAWMQNECPLLEKDVVLQKTPLVFDMSVWECFWGSCYGATTVLAKPNGHKDAEYLCRLIADRNVTTLHFVPSMLEAFVSYLDVNELKLPRVVRQIFCGGEALHPELVDRTYRSSDSSYFKLFNFYGPVESSIGITYYECQRSGSVRIGRPIQNIKVYVLDQNLFPSAEGVLGELYVSGIGLAKGYLNNPELTKERFIINPFATKKDKKQGYSKLYKTGDLVRWCPDGYLEYIGRNDSQVKIRGYRIELGEVENVLTSVDNVKQACVLVKERATGHDFSKYLVGYYVLGDGVGVEYKITEDSLLDELSQLLPSHMIPSILVEMVELPLTINGKLDRSSLPDPEFGVNVSSYVAPRSEVEVIICQVWQEILAIDKVGVRDDFFRIGGDSILTIQVSSQLCKAEFSCTVKAIFEYRTVEQLARHLLATKAKLEVIQAQMNEGIFEGDFIVSEGVNNHVDSNPIFMFPPGHGGVESYYTNLVPNFNDQRLILFNNYFNYLGDHYQHIQKKMTIEKLAEYYRLYLQRSQPKGAYVLFGWSFGGVLAFEIARQLENQGKTVAKLILMDAYFGDKPADELLLQGSDQGVSQLDSEIILFKAGQLKINDDEYRYEEAMMAMLKKYRDSLLKGGGLSKTLANKKVKVINMDTDHGGWVNDEVILDQVVALLMGL